MFSYISDGVNGFPSTLFKDSVLMRYLDLIIEFNCPKFISGINTFSYFDNLSCPLLVLHGTNDARVSPSSMEVFIEKLKQSDKEYEIFISEGQGHHTNNKELRIIEIQKRLDFLKKHLLS